MTSYSFFRKRWLGVFVVVALALIAPADAMQAAAQQPAVEKSAATLAFEEANALFEKQEDDKALAAYDRAIALDGTKAEFHIGRGRTLARLRKFDDGIAAYTEAIRLQPQGWAGYRYRGHTYVNTRKFDDAITDLTKAEALKKDDYNVYYHLGLARYLKGDYDKAAQAFEGCVANTKTDDERVACNTWLYPAYRRAGKDAEAKRVLDRITPELQVKENMAYLNRLLLFKGTKTEEEVAKAMDRDQAKTDRDHQLAVSTVGYGVGLWHLLSGRPDRAKEYFEKATSTTYWPAFGYVASEVELKKMKPSQ